MDISGSFPDGRNRPEDAPKQATNGAHGPQNTGPSATTQGLRKSLLYKVDDIFRGTGPKSVEQFGQMFPGNPFLGQPGPFTFGTCPSSSLSSWWHHNSDLSLTRRSRIDDQRQLEFRVEFFNAWNTPQFDNPNNDISSGQFGETTRVLDPERPARVIQLGIKFQFEPAGSSVPSLQLALQDSAGETQSGKFMRRRRTWKRGSERRESQRWSLR